MNITLTELIDMINKKTLLRLNKAMICHYECTKNKKIRITYQNGVVECYGCTIDCLETLNAKYNLRLTLNKEHAVLFDNRRQSNKDADPIFQQKNNPLIDEIINVLKELFNKIEKSKKSVYVNITEIKKTVNSIVYIVYEAYPYNPSRSSFMQR